MDIGTMIGEGAGLGAGLLIPGAQPFIPELMSGGGALGGMIGGSMAEKKASKMDLPLTDPMQVEYMNTLLRKQKALETGTAYAPEQDLIKQIGGKAQENILKLSGGNVGAAVGNTMAVNRSTGKNMNELFGQMSLEALKMDELIGNVTDKIAARKLGVQAYKQQQAMTAATQEKQDAMKNLMALVAQNPKMATWLQGLFEKTSTPTDTGGGSTLDNPQLFGTGGTYNPPLLGEDSNISPDLLNMGSGLGSLGLAGTGSF